jgi:hypothetical protein
VSALSLEDALQKAIAKARLDRIADVAVLKLEMAA